MYTMNALGWAKPLIMATMIAGAPYALAADSEPARIVEDTAGRILEQVETRRSEFQENPSELAQMVKQELSPLLDEQYSARLILGRHGRGLAPEKIQKFAEALSTVLTQRYSVGILQFRSRDQMEILPGTAQDSERLTRVRTRIKLQNGGSAPVDYAFRKTDAGWKVFDVSVEGISYVLTFRNQLGPRVASQGIDKVTADLLAGNIQIEET